MDIQYKYAGKSQFSFFTVSVVAVCGMEEEGKSLFAKCSMSILVQKDQLRFIIQFLWNIDDLESYYSDMISYEAQYEKKEHGTKCR